MKMTFPAYDNLANAGAASIQRANRTKLIVAISLVLVLVSCVITALLVATDQKAKADAKHDTQGKLFTDDVCNFTDYHLECTLTYQPFFDTNYVSHKATPKTFFQIALNATLEAVNVMWSTVDRFAKGATDIKVQQAYDCCKELSRYAIEELRDSINVVSSSEGQTSFADHSADLKNCLSAVISYEVSCANGFKVGNYSAEAYSALEKAQPITSNALAIINNMDRLFEKANLSYAGAPRRVLAQDEGLNPLDMLEGERRLMGSTGEEPNVVVAKDGSGKFKTITAALNAMPKNHEGRYVIYVKAGIYDEIVEVSRDMVNVLMYGDGPTETIVLGNRSRDTGFSINSATFAAIGDGFIAKSMGFRNTGIIDIATALLVMSDKSAFFDCLIDGYIGTLYARVHRQFYRNCTITGAVEFIYGDAAIVIQNCTITAKKPNDDFASAITVQGRADKGQNTGTVFHHCNIVPDEDLYAVRIRIPGYLGTPWRNYSRVVVMGCMLGDFIAPEGWVAWESFDTNTNVTFLEFGNTGVGAKTNHRVKWAGVKLNSTRAEVEQYTVGSFIQGAEWLDATGVPYDIGLES